MPDHAELRTKRLLLRGWRESDLPLFARLNADPQVMRHLQGPRSRASSDASVQTFRREWDRRGWGVWAVDVVDQAGFIGYVGLAEASFVAPFTPSVEVGWRLARSAWGFGYATEGARAALAFGFTEAKLPEILSFTATINHRSRAIMERIGLRRDPAGDFDHPSVPEGSDLRPHVLYRSPRGTRAQYFRCPCGSGDTYGACCGRFSFGTAVAATAELLMRSRYAAFAMPDARYLRDTWDPATRPEVIDLDDQVVWTRLEILGTVRGGPFDNDGMVEFRAHYRSPQGRGVLHEQSRFVRRYGQWVYVDGDVYPA